MYGRKWTSSLTSTICDTVIMEVMFPNGKLVQLNVSVLSIKWTGDIQNVSKVIAFCDGTHYRIGDDMISCTKNQIEVEIPQHSCPKIVKSEEATKLKRKLN